MERLLEDIRFGFRSFKSNPTFSMIAVLTLALGIGITTSMFTLVNSVLLQPLPFPDADELVYISTINKKQNSSNNSADISFIERVREAETPLSEVGYFAYDQATLTKGDQQKPFTVMITSSNYLAMFDVQPQLGRWYEESDVNTQSVVIADHLWNEEFDRDPGILERVIKIDRQDFRVIGVMPPNYSVNGYRSVELWKPINELVRPVIPVARLKPGLTIEQALLQSNAIQRIINQISGDSENVWEIQYTGMLDSLVKDSRPSLYLLLAAVFAVFLIAVLNVANLTFAQYTNRTQELAVRVSVGASRFRLLRQLLTESALLCVIGGILGLLIAAWSLELIKHHMGMGLPRLHELSLDSTTVLAILTLITVSTLATTLIPAHSIVSPNKLAAAIKQAGRKVTGDKNSQRVRRAMVTGEVCIAVVLLICAGLLLRSYTHLANQPTGFDSEGIMTGHVWLPDSFQPTPNRHSFWQSIVDSLEQQPNVGGVAATSTMPMGRTGIDYPVNYSYPGAPAVPRGEEPSASVRSITSGYFELLNIPVLSGRDFDFRDTQESTRVVIINQKLADSAWPNQPAVGNTLSLPQWMGGDATVIAVVGNVKHRGLRAEPVAEFFLPVTQHNYPGMTFLVKTTDGDFNAMELTMRRTATAIEATAPMVSMGSLEELTSRSIGSEKLLLSVLAFFSAIALFLASIGVYGISDNMVTQRTNEIGIRMAIGAKPEVIRRWIIKDTTRPVLFGAVIGLILAFISSRFIASVLYGVNTVDPLTFATVPAVLILVGIVATWMPARRATRVHPQQALQYE